MSEKVREPLFFEDADDEPEPEPSTESAGSGGRLTAVGSDLGNGEGDEEPPMVVLRRWSEDDEEPVRIATGIGAGVTVSRRWFFAPIEDLTLSMRAYNCMRRSGLLTLGHVLVVREEQFLALRNFGRKSYDELREKLDDLGILPVNRDEFGVLPDDHAVN